MRKLLSAVIILLSFNVNAMDSSVGLFGASTDTECVSTYCGRQDETSAMLVVSMDGQYAGGEVLFTDNAGGFSGYVKTSVAGVTFQAGAMLLPDVAYGNAAGFPEVKATSSEIAPFVGLKYKYFALRYTQYTADHSYSSFRQIGTDPVSGAPIIETGNAATEVDKSVVWAGLVFNF